MAGHRKGTEKPTRWETRSEKRAALCLARIGGENTWRDRLGPATDHVRAGLARLARTDPAAAERAAEVLVEVLMQTAAEMDRTTHIRPSRSAA